VTPRAAVRLAWGLWGLALALIVAALAVNTVQVTTGEEGILAVLSLVLSPPGVLAGAGRQPVGWLRCLGAGGDGSCSPVPASATGSLPGPSWVAGPRA
jgi:hypothetical protein